MWHFGYLRGAKVLLSRKDWGAWDAWHAQIDHFVQNPKKRKACESFLSLSEGFFTSGLLFQSTAATWHMRGGDLVMATNADGEPLVDCTGGTLVCLSKGDSARVRDVKGQ